MDIEPETVEPLAIRPGIAADIEDAPTAPAVVTIPADVALDIMAETLLGVLERSRPPLDVAEDALDAMLAAVPDESAAYAGARMVHAKLTLRGAGDSEVARRLLERINRERI